MNQIRIESTHSGGKHVSSPGRRALAQPPPVVLIIGLATQMITLPDELCEALAEHGHFVIRFDNRDVGGSTHLHNVPPPRLADAIVRLLPPYTIADMAKDVVGLLDGLGLRDVHLVGASMGAGSSRRPSCWSTSIGFACSP